MNINGFQYFLILGFTIIGIITNTIQLNPIRFQCDNFVLNTYLYMILGWAIVFGLLENLYNKNINPTDKYIGSNALILIFLLVIGISLLTLMPTSWFITKHITYVITLLIVATLSYPIYKDNHNVLNKILTVYILILISLSIINFIYPNSIHSPLYYGLIILLTLIIHKYIFKSELSIIRSIKDILSLNNLSSIGATLLFMIFIIYDTNSIMSGAKNCIRPDYIAQTLKLS